ncbi:MAG: helix-turn-helix domain-containing protein [Dehalococcoidia bacterium]|nr:MAG: helix-turn-helix domain-containing protein [Dehalococcoidia bacterium]
MSNQGLSIKEAASAIGVSPKTVRRLVKDGKLPAELRAGKYGSEYRILEIPPSLAVQKPLDKGTTQGMDMLRELQERNLQLAGQLGAAQERIRSLENQVRLLTAPRRSWWRRLLKVQIKIGGYI